VRSGVEMEHQSSAVRVVRLAALAPKRRRAGVDLMKQIRPQFTDRKFTRGN
jgi:hypothetical protein